ncbi:MAG: PAS domain S-box protein [Alphaproteobacteria bacterium]|nr:PAS domain S-box protein [Alphaproteobacteria bacterium]
MTAAPGSIRPFTVEDRRLAEAMSNLPEAVALFDRDDRLVFCNPRYRALLAPISDLLAPGITFEAILRTLVERGALDLGGQDLEKFVTRRLERHRAAAGPIELKLSSGTWILIQERRLASGDAITQCIDITRSKEQETALRESNARFDLAMRGAGAGIWDWDLRAGTMTFSPPLREMLWGTAMPRVPNLAGARDPSVPEEDRERLRSAMIAHLKRRAPFAEEFRYPARGGRLRWFHVTGQAIWAPDGRAIRMAGSIIDINDRKRAEATLAEREAQFRAMFENSLDAIMTVDPDSKILAFNPAAERLFGYAAIDVIGRHVGMLGPWRGPDGAPRSRTQTPDALRALIGRISETHAGRADGSDFPIEISVAEVPAGEHNVYMCILRDIEERERVDERERDFVSTVSHELRTPLAAIVGALGLITGGAVGEIPERPARLVAIARANSTRLARLVDDIIDEGRIEAGRLALDIGVHDATRLIAKVIEDNAPLAERRGIAVRFAPKSGAWLVRADASRFQQILTNLLSNALKFSTVDSAVDVWLVRRGDFIRISVQDRGPGIPESFRPRIFGRFARADTTNARSAGGAGLGLYIARRLAEMMAGRVDFETVWGSGSVFHFEIPVGGGPAA